MYPDLVQIGRQKRVTIINGFKLSLIRYSKSLESRLREGMMKKARGLRPIESLIVEMDCTGTATGSTEQKRYKCLSYFFAS